ncbi:hypothetical protein R3P38DRAFT_3184428 [Favolaschia claudopus]|uniref:Uncharacterized protein n=1 Tax=Favolaschia claudopus TaxID=2862362 RepID=A0AAW0C9J5_9AGAR
MPANIAAGITPHSFSFLPLPLIAPASDPDPDASAWPNHVPCRTAPISQAQLSKFWETIASGGVPAPCQSARSARISQRKYRKSDYYHSPSKVPAGPRHPIPDRLDIDVFAGAAGSPFDIDTVEIKAQPVHADSLAGEPRAGRSTSDEEVLSVFQPSSTSSGLVETTTNNNTGGDDYNEDRDNGGEDSYDDAQGDWFKRKENTPWILPPRTKPVFHVEATEW